MPSLTPVSKALALALRGLFCIMTLMPPLREVGSADFLLSQRNCQ